MAKSSRDQLGGIMMTYDLNVRNNNAIANDIF